MSSKIATCGVTLALASVIGLALLCFSSGPAQAQGPVIDLELGGDGATTWILDRVKPGNSGAKTVELHNAGSSTGCVTIWISDIEDIDYGGDGAVLSDYLRFSLSCDRLSSNIVFPAIIYELPQGSPGLNNIWINPLYAGETLTLVWEWEFPETGEPQNDAQGDSLSFTVNYLLEEFASGGGGFALPPPGDGGSGGAGADGGSSDGEGGDGGGSPNTGGDPAVPPAPQFVEVVVTPAPEISPTPTSASGLGSGVWIGIGVGTLLLGGTTSWLLRRRP